MSSPLDRFLLLADLKRSANEHTPKALQRMTAKAFEKARALAAKRGAKKAAKKYQAIVKKYPGTRAAERAAMILRNL